MKEYTIKDIIDIAITSAIYIALTVLNPLSYSYLQLRISEALILLVYFNKKYSISFVLGVFVANFFNSEFMVLDIIFGTISTLIAVILITKSKNLFIASLCPVITSPIVAIEIYIYSNLPILVIILEIVLSMFIIEVIIGYPLFKLLSKNKGFLKLIDSKEYKTNEV